MIEELEELAEKRGTRQPWSEEEDEIVLEYYNRVSTSAILKYLPRRTLYALQNRVKSMRANGREFKYME